MKFASYNDNASLQCHTPSTKTPVPNIENLSANCWSGMSKRLIKEYRLFLWFLTSRT